MDLSISNQHIFEIFVEKYGHPEKTGWSPRQRYKFGYYQAADFYEAIIDKLVSEKTSWIDVGGGRAIFPHNERLSERLAKRCTRMVAVDPSPNVHEHPYAHERHQSLLEDFETEEKFDLATLRMVAEHVTNPDALARKLRELLKTGGMVVIYTINKYSPMPIVTYLTPFSLHFKMKKMIWGGEEKDTFPVAYKMNTRKELRNIFGSQGFIEKHFQYLDDLSTFSKFRYLNLLELSVWKGLNTIGLRYPENNLLGVYQAQAQAQAQADSESIAPS